MSEPADPMNDNDSVFLSNAEETCRICRAEGTKEGPLFHPCKCSGSIRFVHQECLMEWLQHSQKKYCELCKTPFRFTKVYDPNMPTRLPLPIFFTLAFKHLYRLVVQVLRFILVVFVWLFWLPWSIRSVWRFYFWVADGGLFEAGYHKGLIVGSMLMNTSSTATVVEISNATSPAEQLKNMSAIAAGNNNTSLPSSPAVRSSYRIGAGLANLTSSQQANQIILDTFEGQIITILVVFAFILIFLIREWVVQQQPPVPMDGNAQFGQADARVDELIAAVGRAREERAAVRPPPQAGDANGVVQQPQAGLALPVVRPQPMFAGGRGAERDNPDDDENASEESIFGGSESISSFNDGRSDNAAGVVDRDEAGQRIHELGGPNPLQDLMNFVDFNPGSDYYSPRDEALQNGESLQLAADAPSSSSTGAEVQGDSAGAARRRHGTQSEFQIDDNYMDSQFVGAQPFHPTWPLRRPSLDRERIAQAAEMRRNIEERGRISEGSVALKGVAIQELAEEEGESSKTGQESSQIPYSGKGTAEGVANGSVEGVVANLNPIEALFEEKQRTEQPAVISNSSDKSPAPQSQSSTTAPQASYNFDLSSSGSSFQWNTYSEFASKLDDEGGFQKGKGVGGASTFAGQSFTVADEKGESSRAAGLKWDESGDLGISRRFEASVKDLSDRWTGRDDVSNDYESSEDGDVPPLIGLNPSTDNVPAHSMHGAITDSMALENRLTEGRPEANQHPGLTDNEPLEANPPGSGASGLVFDDHIGGNDAPPFLDEAYGSLHEVLDNATEAVPEVPIVEQANEAIRIDNNFPPVEAIQPPADDVAGLGEEEIEVDVDDLDGVLELVGMRGPLMALVQNGMFSAVLITATIGIGVWVPYIWGRIVLLVLGHPLVFFAIVPHKVVMMLVNLCIDMSLVLVCFSLVVADRFVKAVLTPTSWVVPQIRFIVRSEMVANLTRGITNRAQKQISDSFKMFVSQNIVLRELQLSQHRKTSFAFPNLSDLNALRVKALEVIKMVAGWLGIESSGYLVKLQDWVSTVGTSSSSYVSPTNPTLQSFAGVAANSTTSSLSPGFANLTTLASPNRAVTQAQLQWSAFDQVMSVIAGYAFFTIAGAIYLQRKRAMAQDGQPSRGVERRVIEGLAQAGSVMKVVLIIGIEMFVFPLYCGILLDFALLPLFENATIWTRWKFMSDYVFTSLFVHWFIGTCYMFHFALFVSMCRKIMREGVLYFIRDPDDPTFHPVKEVLERPVSTQLKKIGFSAFIYGILVVVFLGGVVWSLAYGFNGLLPIHWSSNEPVLEFPVDLLFYNFFMPMAIKYFRPSNTLEQMYGWWFKLCAKTLRLSCFLFGERHPEEEGRHIRGSWKNWLLMRKGDPNQAMSDPDVAAHVEKQSLPDVYFHKDGRFVRAPAKDSVRPGRENLFIPVTEDNVRLDGKPDPANGEFGPNNDNVKVVYLPPHFKARIGMIIGLIWVFTAACGVAVTIGPLVFGRLVLGMMLPKNLRMNDLYAFSLGLYIFGAVLFLLSSLETMKKWAVKFMQSIKSYGAVKDMVWNYTARAFRILYIIVAFVVVLPSLFALVMEFYVIIPIQTYFSNGEQHFIHFAQDWTLGVLYIKLMGRMLLMNQDSQWARDLRRIVHRGYLDPDIWVATKNFILPGAGAMLAALFLPLLVGLVITRAFFAEAPKTIVHQVYRYSYPAVLVAFLISVGLYFLKEAFDMWKQSLRDEIYLRGEQLHNHGENQSEGATSSSPVAITSADTSQAVQAPEDVQEPADRLQEEEEPLLGNIDVGGGGEVQVER